jgi:hypothetical protein
MLTRAEALEIVSGAIADMNSGKDADHHVVVYEERTIERDHVFGFFCNTKKFKETGNPRHALIGIGPIIVSRRTGAFKVCGSNPHYRESIDSYERRAAAGDW